MSLSTVYYTDGGIIYAFCLANLMTGENRAGYWRKREGLEKSPARNAKAPAVQRGARGHLKNADLKVLPKKPAGR